MTGDRGNISEIMQSIKSHSGHLVKNFSKVIDHVWQKDFYPRIIDGEKQFHNALAYIHANPIKHGYVKYQDQWRYSSYRNYYLNDESIVRIDYFD
jgi:REP element-mobilizing transposase RayT